MKTLKRMAAATLVIGMLAIPTSVSAASPDVVILGDAAPFAVLGASTVTNTGPTVVTGELGVSPGTDITGFPLGLILLGSQHSADALAGQAQAANTAAYLDAASRSPDTATNYDTVGGLVLVPGVYNATSTMGLTGTLTLDAQGDVNARWIFQVGSALTTAPSSTVAFLNGVGQACNVFWQVTSDVTIDTNTTFVGTILALNSIWVRTGASIHGRALAQVGEVTLDNNVVTRSDCAAFPAPTPTPTAEPTPTPTSTPTPTPTPAPTDSIAPAASAANPPAVPAAVTAPVQTDAPTVDAPGIAVDAPTVDVTLPPTDTDPLGSNNGDAQNFGGVLVLLGGLLVLAAACIARGQPARR